VFSLPSATLSKRRGLVLVPILAALIIAAPVAARQPAVQPLNPEPPDFYACTAIGGGTICRATTSDPYELVPSGIWCGSGAGAFEVLDSGGHEVRATRYYDADGNLTRRIRVHSFPGAHFTNPRNGATIAYQQRNTDWDVLAVPGDLSTSTFSGHGVISMTVPGRGAVLLEAGIARVAPSGEVELQAGRTDLSDYFAGDASVVDDLCAALISG
jgi:hypothetical protein